MGMLRRTIPQVEDFFMNKIGKYSNSIDFETEVK